MPGRLFSFLNVRVDVYSSVGAYSKETLFNNSVFRVGAYIRGIRLFESWRYVLICMVITEDIDEIIK